MDLMFIINNLMFVYLENLNNVLFEFLMSSNICERMDLRV